jgi:hypothetical protein
MGFRFRRSIKILPGIRLNFGKRGISTSIGVRGAHVTFGKTGTRTTVGLPGSGLSFTHLDKTHDERPVDSTPDPAPESNTPPGKAWRGWLWIALIIFAIAAALAHLTK